MLSVSTDLHAEHYQLAGALKTNDNTGTLQKVGHEKATLNFPAVISLGMLASVLRISEASGQWATSDSIFLGCTLEKRLVQSK